MNDTVNIAQYMEKDTTSLFESLGNFCSHPDWCSFGNLSLNSIIVGILVAVILVGIRAVTKKVPTRFRDVSLKWFFAAVWLYGFVVYDVGMCTGQYISLWTNAPLAILYAFKIFLFDSDVSEIHGVFHSSWVYSLNFALVHFLAAVISTLFLIKHFGFNILARFKMWRESRLLRKTVGETFVFWGFNEPTIHLVESIREEHPGSDYRIIIVQTGKNDNDSPEERTGFSRIFNFLAMPTSELEKLQKLGCLTTGSYTCLSGLNAGSDNEDIIGKALKLKSLQKLLQKHTSRKIHFLFLNDDEKENLHDVALLLNDSSIKDFVNAESEQKREAIFYCLARYNSVHRVIEDQIPSSHVRVKVIDSSHINVEMLKENPALLPVRYVDIEADATISSSFNALVVGFSEVGQDSVRFLYEFGAFVKHGSTDEIATRSEFHLDVVDKNMSDLAGVFVANAPSIKPSMPFIEKGKNDKALIELHEMDCRSVQFYQKLTEDWIGKLNYVVVATDDDELNISLGVRIFKAATRFRKDMEKLCILVRAHSDDDGHIRRIAEHYNRLWTAYEKAPVDKKGRRIHQSEVTKDSSLEKPVIRIFGLDKETFTYRNIIADELEQKARDYADRYVRTTQPNKIIKKTAFDDNFDDVMQLRDEWAGYYPTYFGIMYLRRTQSQDMANCLHRQTKEILLKEALKRCHHENFEFSKLTRAENTTKYIWPRGEEPIGQINRIAIVLAQTEHLRWNASHEILGYIHDRAKDEVRCMHDCLKDWSDLSEAIRSYDCNVSDFTLGIRLLHD